MSAEVWSGPFAICVALLLLGGAAKIVRPTNTARALAAMGVRGGERAVRAGAAAEVAIGLAALAGAALGAALVAASYAAFAGFVAVALRRRTPLSTCGCFGKADTPPTMVHLVLNMAAAAVAVIVWLDGGFDVSGVGAGGALGALAYILFVVAGTAAAYAAMTVLPRAASRSRTR